MYRIRLSYTSWAPTNRGVGRAGILSNANITNTASKHLGASTSKRAYLAYPGDLAVLYEALFGSCCQLACDSGSGHAL